MEGSLLGRANEKEMWVESIKTLREGNVLVPLRHTSLKTMSGRKDREGKRRAFDKYAKGNLISI